MGALQWIIGVVKEGDMQQVAITEVTDDGAAIPADVLRTLGVARGDKVAFVARDDGSISLAKAGGPFPALAPASGRIRDIVGVFSTGVPRTLADDAAFLREVRYGDEPDDE
jgi:bifunctional DNA-binding transcriptional regulator/antitoxin component of YhaV-PrlF toxin-antitoxin module